MSSPPLPPSHTPPIHRSSPLSRNPVDPPTPHTPPTQHLLSNVPARLSSSPASTPRIVDSPPMARTRSLRPEMSASMEGGRSPGLDFFEDGSTDDEEWEDDNGTREFSEVEGLGLGLGIMNAPEYADRRSSSGGKRGGRQEVLTALPPFNQMRDRSSKGTTSIYEDAEEEERRGRARRSANSADEGGKMEARQMSLKRMSKGPKIVHNHSPSLGGGGADATSDSRNSTASQGSVKSVKSFPPFVYRGPVSANSPSRRNRHSQGHTHTHTRGQPSFNIYNDNEDGNGTSAPSPSIKRHRRNTSSSVLTDSIVNAHLHTMRALESLSPSASLSMAYTPATTGSAPYPHSSLQSLLPSPMRAQHFRFPLPHPQQEAQQHISFSSSRPLPVFDDEHETAGFENEVERDPHRPRHLPDYYIKTPYPGWETPKIFPRTLRKKPGIIGSSSSQRQHREWVLDDKSGKGRRVLGLVASDGEFDLRGRYFRNSDSRERNVGVGRSRSAVVREKRVWSSKYSGARDGSGVGDVRTGQVGIRRTGTSTGMGGGGESSVFAALSSSRRTRNGREVKVERIVIPSSLTTHGSARLDEKKWIGKRRRGGEETVDFDDRYLALQIHAAYARLAGSWILRVLSARRLHKIEIGQLGIWSGTSPSSSCHCHGTSSLGANNRLLAAHALDDPEILFTESALMDLYKTPELGRARYGWVHWARRLAAANKPASPPSSYSHTSSLQTEKHGNRHSAEEGEDDETSTEDLGLDARASTGNNRSGSGPLDAVTVLTFTHRFSTAKILVVLLLSMILSVLATLLWIFVGVSEWPTYAFEGRPARVGSGMLVGILVLALEGAGIAGWIWGSWVRF